MGRLLHPDHAVVLAPGGPPRHRDRDRVQHGRARAQGDLRVLYAGPLGQFAAGLAGVAGERVAADLGGIRVDGEAGGPRLLVFDQDPAVDDRPRGQVVHDVAQGARVMGLVDRDVDKPDTEPLRDPADGPVSRGHGRRAQGPGGQRQDDDAEQAAHTLLLVGCPGRASGCPPQRRPVAIRWDRPGRAWADWGSGAKTRTG